MHRSGQYLCVFERLSVIPGESSNDRWLDAAESSREVAAVGD